MPLAAALAQDAVEERVHHHVAARDPELGEEALDALARFADEDAADNSFVRRRVLPDHEHTCAAVEAAAVEDRTPFRPEVGRWVDLGARVVPHQRREAARVAGVEVVCHRTSAA